MTRSWYNRRNSGRRTEWTQSPPPPQEKKIARSAFREQMKNEDVSSVRSEPGNFQVRSWKTGFRLRSTRLETAVPPAVPWIPSKAFFSSGGVWTLMQIPAPSLTSNLRRKQASLRLSGLGALCPSPRYRSRELGNCCEHSKRSRRLNAMESSRMISSTSSPGGGGVLVFRRLILPLHQELTWRVTQLLGVTLETHFILLKRLIDRANWIAVRLKHLKRLCAKVVNGREYWKNVPSRLFVHAVILNALYGIK
jgi:hypothetical protein